MCASTHLQRYEKFKSLQNRFSHVSELIKLFCDSTNENSFCLFSKYFLFHISVRLSCYVMSSLFPLLTFFVLFAFEDDPNREFILKLVSHFVVWRTDEILASHFNCVFRLLSFCNDAFNLKISK